MPGIQSDRMSGVKMYEGKIAVLSNSFINKYYVITATLYLRNYITECFFIAEYL